MNMIKKISSEQQYPKKSWILKLTSITMLTATLTLTGCSLFSVYKIDIPQGTPVTQSQASKLKRGMTENQVLYILGSPALRDTIEVNRWDYLYDYKAGTNGKRKGIENIHNASQHLTIYFTDNKVSNIVGIETLPQ